jgi:murein L,D-transpeptidase YcbB/YkuD
VADGAKSQRAKDAAAVLGSAGEDGLDPEDYRVPQFADADPAKLARDELAMTDAVLDFVRHAATGRVSFSRVSGAIYYDLKFPEAAAVLSSAADATDLKTALRSYFPQHAAYRALRTRLADIRSEKKKESAALADTVIANMERWRWVPHDLGTAHVIVNIPDFTLKVVNDGKTEWSTRIVVGKVGKQATPLMTETMKFITVNPTWNVPPSIIRNEYLPVLQRDPDALARIGLKVTYNNDGSIRVYQPPGDRNALGRIRFNFPNRFLVYQHDTPDKHLFAKSQRTFSHGCMRVQDPERYAEVLLSISQPEAGLTAAAIRKMYGNRERNITLTTPIPVHLTYQTAFVDEAGKLQTRPDVYGHDKTITRLLQGNRGNADTPVARNYHSSSKPVMANAPEPADSYAQDRWGRTWFGSRNGRMARQFEYGGSTFYPRRVYGAPN